MNKAEHHAILIRAAIRAARADGVNVNLDWDEDEDGIHVSLGTSVHRRQPEGWMEIVEGPYLIEGY